MSRGRKRDKLAAFFGIDPTPHPDDVAAALEELPKIDDGADSPHQSTKANGEDQRATSPIESEGGEDPRATSHIESDSDDTSTTANDVDEDSAAGATNGRPLLEKNHGAARKQNASRALLGRGTSRSLRDVLSDVAFEGALVRNHSGHASRDRTLSEAAALYGTATMQYTNALRNEERDAAKVLGRIYVDFEARQVRLFCHYHDDDEGESESAATPLQKVLNASTELLTETELLWDKSRKKKVRFVMPPRFESNPTVDVAWVAAVSSICARQISSQTGGKEGHCLPKLTVTELLDVIAWVEHFQDTMERINTDLSSRLFARARKMAQVNLLDASSQPALFRNDGASATARDAEDSLAWVYKALMDMHTQARDELLIRTRAQTIEWASAAYKAEHRTHRATDGRLFTSLPEDVFTPMSIQLRTICDRLPLSSDVLPAMIAVVLSAIRMVQLQEGGGRLSGFEQRCAAANDFERMGEEWDEISSEILQECFPQFQGEASRDEHIDDEDGVECVPLKQNLEAVSSELVHTYASDAVRAAKSMLIPVFGPIRSAIEPELFNPAWEDNYTQNELAKTLTATIADFLSDLESFVGSYLLEKATGALISASVVFYIECLLRKAGGHGDIRASRFGDNSRALMRLKGDMSVMRSYFNGLVKRMPALARTVEVEFKLLTAVHELLSIAGGQSKSEAGDGILVLHERIRDVGITTKVVSDMWNLIAPQEKRKIKEYIAAMEPQLLAIAPLDTARTMREKDKLQIPGLRFDDMVAELYAAEKDRYHLEDLTHEFVAMSGETLARGKAKFERGKKKFAKATAKLTIGHSVRAPASGLAEC